MSKKLTVALVLTVGLILVLVGIATAASQTDLSKYNPALSAPFPLPGLKDPLFEYPVWRASKEIYNETGVGNTVLPNGSIVQLIWDQNGDGLAPAYITQTLPIGDDVLLDSSTIGTGSSVPGTFTKAMTTTLVVAGDKVYVRAWNGTSLNTARCYGNSTVMTVSGNVASDLDATASVSFATAICFPPTGTTVTSFTAAAALAHIVLEWQTASEIDIAGFNVYRGEKADAMERGAATKLNAVLIPNKADNPILGASYRYVDAQVHPAATYYYWLEGIATTGEGQVYGPATATLAAWNIYLPVVLRR